MSAGECINPEKVIHRTREGAQKAAKSISHRGKRKSGTHVREYYCPAGHWHITTSKNASPRQRKRLKERNQ